jgi:small-conductance mechanosensitive channel
MTDKPGSIRMLRRAAVTALIIGTAPLALVAQEAAPARQQADTTTVAAPRPIASAEIPDGAVAVSTQLNTLRARIAADTAIAQIETRLRDLVEMVDAEDDSVVATRLERQSLDNLVEIERGWRGFERQLVGWQSRLAERSRILDGIRDSLRQLRTVWELTRDSTPRADLTPELRDRVVSTIRSIDSMQTRLQEPRQYVLALQDQTAQTLVVVSETIGTIRSAQDLARRRLLQSDAIPIWKIFSAPAEQARPTSLLVQAEGQRLRAIGEYLRENRIRLFLHLTILAGILAAAFAVRRRAATWQTSTYHIHAPAELFSRPVPAAVLTALALSRPIHTSAPQAFFSLLWIIGVPLLAAFLPSILDRRAMKIALTILLVFAIEMLLDIVPLDPRSYRLILFGLQVTALTGAVAFVKSGNVKEWAAESRWWRVARWGAVGGIVMTGAAVLVNVTGFVGLSLLLVRGAINAATAAVALAAVVAFADGLVIVFVETTLGNLLHVVDRNRSRIIGFATGLIRLGAVVMWLYALSRDTRTLQPGLDAIFAVLHEHLTIGSWTISLGDILVFVFAVWLTLTVARTVRALLRDDVLARVTLPRGVGDAVSSLAYYVLIALGFLFAVGAAGLDLSQLALVLGALSVGIGFGLQNVVNNFISGLILLFERPIQIGDTIEIEGLMGKVQNIGIRSSTVRTFSGSEVIVPNGDLIAERVINWTLSDRRRRVEVPIGVAYGSDPRQVIELLTQVAAQHPDALQDPPVATHFVGFGDSSLDFKVWVWTTNFDGWWQLRTDVFTNAYEALAEAGIEIPFPQRDLHLRSVDPRVGDLLGPTHRKDPPAS